MQRAIGAINWVLMLATLASVVALYAIKHDTRRLEVRVLAQERALERARNDVTVLTAERAHLARPARLEVLARAIGMSPIAADQYLRLDFNRRDVVPSPVAPEARTRDVGEGQGGGDCRTSKVGIPPTPSPSPHHAEGVSSTRRGGESAARSGGPATLPALRQVGPPSRDFAAMTASLNAILARPHERSERARAVLAEQPMISTHPLVSGAQRTFTPHRPPRPEKSEGGIAFTMVSEYEPKGDQPTAN